MNRWMKLGAAFAGLVAVGATAAAVIGSSRWQRSTTRMVDRMRAANEASVVSRLHFRDAQLSDLPPPVSRFFRFALTDGQPIVARAWLRSEGEFLGNPPDGWSAFTAEQHVSVQRPGFVWDASIRMLPLVPVRVRDAYVAGAGSTHAEAAGLVTLMDMRDTPEMAAGSLLRYLAEAAWYPTALLPGEAVHWTAIDDSSARLALRDGPTTVSLDVYFDAAGAIARVYALRHREVDGAMILTPWEGTFTDYRRVDGMMIPTSGEVAWLLPEGPLPYWRGRIVEAHYGFAAPAR